MEVGRSDPSPGLQAGVAVLRVSEGTRLPLLMLNLIRKYHALV